MAVGRISGPLLKANLLRDGVNLAFETDLLFLDVVNGRIGIKTASPQYTLDVIGTTRTTNLQTTTQAKIASFTFSSNIIASTNGTISFEPSGSNPVVYQSKLLVDNNIQISSNIIQTTTTNSDLEIKTNGTGQVNINSNVLVSGNVHATGTITADGNITLGNENTDSVIFNADVASNVIPDLTNQYDLGSDPTTGGKEWKNSYINSIYATDITSDTLEVNGIDLLLTQGNIIYVSTNGNDVNEGLHQNNPVLTVKHALSLATSGTTVYIYPGTYSEIFPLTIPVGVTVKGAGLRSVTIQPTVGTIDKDAFLINGEITIEDLTISNFRFNSTNNTGYAFKFANNFTVTTRSPYIRNVSVITKGSTTSPADPYGFDSNDAGKGAYLDGSIATIASKEVSCLFHSVTFITPNQETLTATNGVRVEWLSSFTYFADKGLYAFSSTAGAANAGYTRLKISTRTGTWAVGNTISYYDTDGTTVLGSGTIDSIDADYVNIAGRHLGFQTITDRLTKTIFANGSAKLSNTQYKYGISSLYLDGSASFLNIASQPDFNFGSGNFTIELWVYRTTSPGVNQILIDMRTVTPQLAPVLFLDPANAIGCVVNGANVITGSVIPINTWTHIALAKSGTSTKLFVNGTQSGSTYTDNNTYIQSPVRIGARFDNTSPFTGYIDDVRISKGTAKYTTTFIAPTDQLTGDLSTVLSLHFNGNNNSTTFIDDGVTLQDVRTSAGGTSTIIDFADYSDFGAEIRSIGSANVYGNYGVYGDGAGVTMYLVSHNFSYVGSGKDSTNSQHDEGPEGSDIDPYEIVELNTAKIFHTSVNHEGDFRVGDKFYVDQSSGDVFFNNQNLSITAVAGVSFTDGTYTTSITSQDVSTGNIKISGNTIQSLTGDVNVVSAGGSINLQNDTYITGNLDVTGDVTIGGNITIGDQTTDTVTFTAGITSNIVPSTTATYDLGTTSLRWNNLYLSRVEIDGLVIDSNTISTTLNNDDLTLTANGAGRIYIPSNNVQIDQSLTVTQDLTVTTGTTSLKAVGITGTITQTGDITQTGNITTSGTVAVTGNITSTGNLQLPQITLSNNSIYTTPTDTDLEIYGNGTGGVIVEGLKVVNNTIQSVASNTNITLTPQGTGGVIINSTTSLQIPVGTTAQRPDVPTNGMVRYNTTLSRYEGYSVKVAGSIISAVQYDSIVAFNGQTDIVIIGGNNDARCSINGTVITITTPGSGYTAGIVTIGGGTRIVITVDGFWLQLNGVVDNSGNTRILAEATPGANDNTLYFYANNNLTATIDSTKLFTQRFQTTNLDFNGSTITPLTANTDINLTSTGTGSVRIGNLSIRDSTITNVVSNAVTEFLESGTGYVKFTGTAGIVIPVGDTATNRPPVAEIGMIRFNTAYSVVEVFNGLTWGSIAGNTGGVTLTTANEIGLASALIFG